ncbi:MAG TPA: hypothetical protein VFD36_23800 [Kofleriaceae bacterium]|nr:hypothetical protein [Kofleriaceae bacterium]
MEVPLMSAPAAADPARRFTRVFLAVVVLGLTGSAAMALLVDPTATFGTGRIPSILTSERNDKPVAFRTIDPPPQAVVFGSSRVMKLRPSCITEITGLPAFNFGLSNAMVEDLTAAYRFIRARGRAPLRELIIGLDVEVFDDRAEPDQRLHSAGELAAYLDDGAGLSFDTATRGLFSWQALRLAGSSLWARLHPRGKPPSKVSYARDGFITYDIMEAEMTAGTYSAKQRFAEMAAKLSARRGTRDFTELSERRVARFRELMAAAHADGVTVDVFIPPLSAAMERILDTGAAHGRLAARRRELDAVLAELDRAGQIHYLRVARVEDFGGDPAGYFDGVHMTEANASRLLLAMFHRSHGCGV